MLKKLRLKLALIILSMVAMVILISFVALLIATYRNNAQNTRMALEAVLTMADSSLDEELLPSEPEDLGQMEPGQTEPGQTDPGQADQGQADFETKSPDSPEGGDREAAMDSEANPEDSQNNRPEFGRHRDERLESPVESFAFTPAVAVSVSEAGEIVTDYMNNGTISDENLAGAVNEILAKYQENPDKSEGYLWEYDLRYLLQKETADEADCSFRIALADCSNEREQILSLLHSFLIIGLPSLAMLFVISLFLSSLALRPVKAAMDKEKQFIADASHELKTPLTVIMANYEILASHPTETIASQSQWVESSREEGAHMKKLIEDLLFLARNDAERLSLTFEKGDLSELTEELLLTFEPLAFEKGLTLDSRLDPEVIATFDRTRIRQLIMILLDNAMKYTDPKGTVTLTLAQTSDTVTLTVNNTGLPVSPEDLPHLFDRFYRTDPARSRLGDSGSHGLGLSIAAAIAKTHKGHIEAASDREHGTTFTVTLPK